MPATLTNILRDFLILLLFGVVLLPRQASAVTLTSAEWDRVYRDIGSMTYLPVGGIHYSSAWQFAAAGFDYRYIQLRGDKLDNAHWENYLGRAGAPRGFSTIGGAAWVTVANRVRIAGGFRHEPVLNLAAGTVALSVQLLRGTSDSSAFFLGLGTSYMQNPQFKLITPHLFGEWSNELFRTTGTETPPWIMYIYLRLDQGFRVALNSDPAGQSSSLNKPMDSFIRGGIRTRHRNFQLSYDFGGQQSRLFSHGFTLSYVFDRRVDTKELDF